MPQPGPDNIHLNPGLKEMNGGRVAKDVGRDPSWLTVGTFFKNSEGMAANDLVDPEAGQRSRTSRGKDRAFQQWPLSQELLKEGGGPGPQWTDPPLVALSVKAGSRLWTEVQMAHTQIRYFLHSCPGVVEEEQQGMIAQSKGAA